MRRPPPSNAWSSHDGLPASRPDIAAIAMTREQGTPPDACPVDRGLPGCDTGPAARTRFVARELTSVWRELRGHRQSAAAQSTTRKAQR